MAGARVFNVQIDAATVLASYDPFAAAGGKHRAAQATIMARHSCGRRACVRWCAGALHCMPAAAARAQVAAQASSMVIAFKALADQPLVCAVAIQTALPPSPLAPPLAPAPAPALAPQV